MSDVFAGLKVADFSWVGVGPITVKHLADHGATVVHVESSTRPDVLRLNPPFRGKPGINRSQFFANYNSSKLGLSLNLNTPEGQAVARRLVAWADVVAESYTPRAMRKWGLSYEDVRAINPSVVMISTCQQGQTGPHAYYAGYGNLAAALAGFFHLTGWPDREPAGPYGAYTDFINPHFATAALVAALDHRQRTGQGQYIDLSQYEGAVQFIAPAILDYTVNGQVMTRAGNAVDWAAPHNAYPCAGEDRWLALTIRTDEQWAAFGALTADQPFAADPRFATLAGRKAHEAELDALIAAWTAGQNAEDLMTRCQAAGVSTGVVQNCADLHADPQIEHRNFFVELDHAEMGPSHYDGLIFGLSETPGALRRPAPVIGQHNEQVLRDLLGYDEDEIAELLITGALD